jgi:hypothetical protein
MLTTLRLGEPSPPSSKSGNSWGSRHSHCHFFLPPWMTGGAVPTTGEAAAAHVVFSPLPTTGGAAADNWGSHCSRRRFANNWVSRCSSCCFFLPLPTTGGAVADNCVSYCSRCHFYCPCQLLGEPTIGGAITAVRALFRHC